MALEATHIRFALDLKDKYQVQDIEKYISGAIYPDSRYISGIDRELTHNDDLLNPEFAKDDFRKGWQVHYLGDVMYNRMKKKALFEPFLKDYNGYVEERWIASTAMKIIQDMDDMQKFPIQDYLVYLEYVHNPNGEDIQDVRKYNQIMIDLYKGKSEITLEDYYRMWTDLGLGKELRDKIKLKIEEYLADAELIKKIKMVYADMIKFYGEYR